MEDEQVDTKPWQRRRSARFGHGLWALVITVAALLMGFFAIDFYDQYRVQEKPVVQLLQNTSAANAYLAGAVVCLLLAVFLAYMAFQHWRASGRS